MNDIIVYVDGGCSINPQGKQRFNDYINMVNNHWCGLLRFHMPHHLEHKWTNKGCQDYFKKKFNLTNE